jgi:hypothetical protein
MPEEKKKEIDGKIDPFLDRLFEGTWGTVRTMSIEFLDLFVISTLVSFAKKKNSEWKRKDLTEACRSLFETGYKEKITNVAYEIVATAYGDRKTVKREIIIDNFELARTKLVNTLKPVWGQFLKELKAV